MKSFRKFLPGVMTALVGVAMLGAPNKAHAVFNLYLQETGVNGGVPFLVNTGPDFNTVGFSGTYGDFAIRILGASSDNGAALSDLLSAATSVTNNSGSVATLRVYASQTNYTLPAGSPVIVESGMGGSVNNGLLSPVGVFQAYADRNNNVLGLSDYTNGPQNDTQLGSTFDTGSASGLFARLATPFSLTSVVTLTMSGGAVVNYANHINVSPTATTVPAPAGVVLALTGLPCLGFGTWLRRRKVQTA